MQAIKIRSTFSPSPPAKLMKQYEAVERPGCLFGNMDRVTLGHCPRPYVSATVAPRRGEWVS